MVRRVRSPVRAVIDTNIVRGGLRSRRRPEYQCLRFVGLGWVVPLATPALFLEYEDVLLRPETLAATGLTRADVDTVLMAVAAVVPVAVNIDWRPLLPDPDDDMVANCAINGLADRIVTNNVRDLRLVERRFGIRVVQPGAFVEEVRQAFASAPGQEDF